MQGRRVPETVVRSRERVAIATLVLSAACHAVCGASVLLPATRELYAFPAELGLLVLVSFGCSVAAFVVASYRAFLVPHLLRLFALLAAVRLVPDELVGVRILVLLPYLLESSLYAGARDGGVFSGLLLAGTLAPLLAPALREPLAGGRISLALTALAGVAFGAVSTLLVRFRERAGQQESRIEELSEAVVRLSEANRAMLTYAGSVESESAAKERGRVTRELHDSVGYAFTNIIMTMNAAKLLAVTDPEETVELLEGARSQAEAALADTRRILYRLRAIRDTEGEGLRAVARLVKSFRSATGVGVAVSYGNLPVTYGTEIDEALYRLVQEGLTNAFRHAGARTVRVAMWQADTEIRVTVWNDGAVPHRVVEGIGLGGMRERFEGLGGTVAAKGVADGFELQATIPYRRLTPDA